MPVSCGRHIDAPWCNEERSNCWVWLRQSGWRKLHDDNDDATTNFAILAAHAKGDNRNVNVRVDGDRVKEMYVW